MQAFVLLVPPILCAPRTPGSTPSDPANPVDTSLQPLFARAKTLVQSGKVIDALHVLEECAKLAKTSHSVENEARAELGIASCYIRLFQYREALEHSNQALALSASADDNALQGASYGDIATIYKEVGDMESAASAGDKSVALLATASRPDYYARALLNSADINAALGRDAVAESFFRKGVDLARRRQQSDLEAMLQEDRAEVLLNLRDLQGAEHSLDEARRLRTATNSNDFAVIDARTARLQFLKSDYPAALIRLQAVETAHNTELSLLPSWELPDLKGQILLALGRKAEALAAFQRSVTLEDQRRRDVLPSDASNLRTVIASSGAYTDYIGLASALAAEHRDPTLARKAFLTLVNERAWAVRSQLIGALGRGWKLPPDYYRQLHELQELQAEVTLGTDSKRLSIANAKLKDLRVSLNDLENKTLLEGKKISFGNEKDPHKTSLSDIQDRLGRDDLLCSFLLGEDRSFLWTVTKDRMDLEILPSEHVIRTDSETFTHQVRDGAPSQNAAAALSRDLFAHLPQAAARKRHWLLTLDGALLEGVPLAALPAPGRTGEPLAVSHTIRLLAAEALLTARHQDVASGAFLGIADPIYNFADSRRTRAISYVSLQQPSNLSLGRLVSSAREVRRSANAAALPHSLILTGQDAVASSFEKALLSQPEIVHFAVHVVSPEEHGVASSEQAALALSMSPSGRPELLTKESIAALSVPGSLVVLSGCASQQGEIVPAAGIVGLSRSFLLAGASAVLVTAWPTPDDSGAFFQSFYSHFRIATGNVGQRASTALQAAQAEMAASSGYRSKASFWSAYSLISKE